MKYLRVINALNISAEGGYATPVSPSITAYEGLAESVNAFIRDVNQVPREDQIILIVGSIFADYVAEEETLTLREIDVYNHLMRDLAVVCSALYICPDPSELSVVRVLRSSAYVIDGDCNLTHLSLHKIDNFAACSSLSAPSAGKLSIGLLHGDMAAVDPTLISRYDLTINVSQANMYAHVVHPNSHTITLPSIYSPYMMECGYITVDLAAIESRATSGTMRLPIAFKQLVTKHSQTTIKLKIRRDGSVQINTMALNGGANELGVITNPLKLIVDAKDYSSANVLSKQCNALIAQICKRWPMVEYISTPIIPSQLKPIVTRSPTIEEHLIAMAADANVKPADMMEVHKLLLESMTIPAPKRQLFNISEMAWSNFMSYGVNNKLTFDRNLLYLFGSNGSGKTAIIDAIMMLLYAKSSRENIGSFVHANESSFTISGTVESDGKFIHIKRARAKGGSNMDTCTITSNTADNQGVNDMYAAISSIAQTQYRQTGLTLSGASNIAGTISSVCGKPDLALYTCILQQRHNTDLLMESTAVQRSVYERLFGLDIVKQLHAAVSTRCKKFITDNELTPPCKETAEELEASITSLRASVLKYKTVIAATSEKLASLSVERSKLVGANNITALGGSHPITALDKIMAMTPEVLSTTKIKLIEQLNESRANAARALVIQEQLQSQNRLYDLYTKSCRDCSGHFTDVANGNEIKNTIAKLTIALKEASESGTRSTLLESKLAKLEELKEKQSQLMSNAAHEQDAKLASSYTEYMEAHTALTAQLAPIVNNLTDAENKLAARNEFDSRIAGKIIHLNKLEAYRSLFDCGNKSIGVRMLFDRIPNLIKAMNEYLNYMGMGFIVEQNETSSMPDLLIYRTTSKHRIQVAMLSEFEYDVINITMRVALWRQYEGVIPNFFIFDEALAHGDATNIARLQSLFSYMLSWHDAPAFIMIISNDSKLITRVANHIYVERVLTDRATETYHSRLRYADSIVKTTDVIGASDGNAADSSIVQTVEGYRCDLCSIMIKKHASIARHTASARHKARAAVHKSTASDAEYR